MHMRRLFLGLACLLIGSSAAAQTVRADRFTLNAGPCVETSAAGNPEGVVTGSVCDSYVDTDTGVKYYKVSGAGTTGWAAWAGAGSVCSDSPPTTSNCQAASLVVPSSYFEQRLSTDTDYRTQWFVGEDGGHLTAYNASDWMPLRVWAGPVEIGGGGLHIGASEVVDPGLGNALVDGWVHSVSPAYVSQTTGMALNFGDGSIDARYLFVDEMHAKKFIADLEQALAGGQIICKSVGQVGAVFTVPTAGNISVLTMKDLPSAENMAIFESGDWVRIRTFSRAAGSLTITDAWGVVSGYSDEADGLQTWNFARGAGANAGAMAGAVEIPVDSIVLDYGVSGNGFYEVNAIDGLYGVNSPYAQVVTWSGASPVSGNQTLRSRFGNLLGVTGSAEWGLIAGTYAATDGTYFIASDQHFELHGIDLSFWDGSTRTMFLEHTAPYWSMGDPAPTTYSAGDGCWSGMESGDFKWRCGAIGTSANYIAWDGSTGVLTVNGDINITGEGIDADTVVGVAGATVVSGAARGLLGIDSDGNPSLPHATAPTGAGLWLGSSYLGYYDGAAWKTYMDSSGKFYLGGVGGALQWTGAALTISATLSGNGSGITSIDGGNITADTVTADEIAANAITTSELNADSVTSAKIAADTITAADIAANAITASELAAGSVTAADILAGTITATQIAANSLTAAVIDAGAIGTSEMAANSITATQLAANSITAADMLAGTITTTQIAARTIEAGDIAVDTLTANEIAASAIDTDELAALSITAAKIAAGTITADKLNVGSLSAITADLGAVTAGTINISGGAENFEVTATGRLNTYYHETDYLHANEQIVTDGFLQVGGNLTMTAMSGSGIAYACYDANGTFYRGTSIGCY